MRRISLTALVLAGGLALPACGGSDTPPATPMNHPGHGAETGKPAANLDAHQKAAPEHGHDHSHDFPGTMHDFHEVLSPVFHADPGPERDQTACTRAGDMHRLAQAMQQEPAPADAAPDAWLAVTNELTAKVEALQADCAQGGKAAAGKLDEVHTAFHQVMDAIGQSHHE